MSSPALSQLQTRVHQVSVRSLVDFSDTRELAQIMLDAVTAHKHLYEDASILHGDINPNTIGIFTFHDDGPGGSNTSARPIGALIDCDEPLPKAK